MTNTTDVRADIVRYARDLSAAMALPAMDVVPTLAAAIRETWRTGGTIYLCGNGGSAGNANHLANDFLYGAGMAHGVGLRVESLSANAAVLTCLANDIGYENVYAEQLRVKAEPRDVLIVLSGSGNSPNAVKALEMGAAKGMTTFAILGFTGGKCKALAQHSIHFPVDDMQIAEDLQMIIGHVCMKWLVANPLAGAQASAAAE
jgi:D-sedoheptulose 7-phosphate isomerase